MWWCLVYLLVGAGLLIWGAERLIDGATILADVFQLPKAVVGLTLVAIGTSAPELFVNVVAASAGKTEFALANVSGSNLANLCIGLGICAFFGGIAIRRVAFGRDLAVFAIAPAVVLAILFVDQTHSLPGWSIVPLTALMAYYGWSLIGRSDGGRSDDQLPNPGESNPIAELKPNRSAGFGVALFLVGVVALYGGGQATVYAATKMAAHWGIGSDVIALTVIALLTSVPDIAATWVAARRGENEIAVGNILGSNISNVVLVLNATVLTAGVFGTSENPTDAATAFPQLATMLRLDYLLVTLLSLMAWGLVLYQERLGRYAGGFLLIVYVAYLIYRVSNV